MTLHAVTLHKLARFRKRTDAVSTIEFAIIFPALSILMLGGLQLVDYINAVRKVEATASSISEMISQFYNPNNPNTATYAASAQDLHFAYDQTMVVFPLLMKDAARKNIAWWQDITLDFASIQFVSNGMTCAGYDQSSCYVANVVWTTTGTVGNNYRPCGVQLPTTSPTPNRYTLPSYVFGAGTLIAVDVVFTFVPSFGAAFFPSRTISRSVYVQPRYVSLIDFNIIGNDGIATKC